MSPRAAWLLVALLLASAPALPGGRLTELCGDREVRRVTPQCPPPVAPIQATPRPQEPDWLERLMNEYCQALGATYVRGDACFRTPFGGGGPS